MRLASSYNDLCLRKVRRFLAPSKYVYMPLWIPVRIKIKSGICGFTNPAHEIGPPIYRMRESFGAMLIKMVPRVLIAQCLEAERGQLKTSGALFKTGHADNHFWIRRLIFRMVHFLLPTDRNR